MYDFIFVVMKLLVSSLDYWSTKNFFKPKLLPWSLTHKYQRRVHLKNVVDNDKECNLFLFKVVLLFTFSKTITWISDSSFEDWWLVCTHMKISFKKILLLLNPLLSLALNYAWVFFKFWLLNSTKMTRWNYIPSNVSYEERTC